VSACASTERSVSGTARSVALRTKVERQAAPLGIAVPENNIFQRAVVEVLNAIYEEDFLGNRVRVPART